MVVFNVIFCIQAQHILNFGMDIGIRALLGAEQPAATALHRQQVLTAGEL
jgi:hypothetical protein